MAFNLNPRGGFLGRDYVFHLSRLQNQHQQAHHQQHQQNHPPDHQQQQRQNTNTNRSRCFFCGDLGHVMKHCPNGRPVCWNCKLPGHAKRECQSQHAHGDNSSSFPAAAAAAARQCDDFWAEAEKQQQQLQPIYDEMVGNGARRLRPQTEETAAAAVPRRVVQGEVLSQEVIKMKKEIHEAAGTVHPETPSPFVCGQLHAKFFGGFDRLIGIVEDGELVVSGQLDQPRQQFTDDAIRTMLTKYCCGKELKEMMHAMKRVVEKCRQLMNPPSFVPLPTPTAPSGIADTAEKQHCTDCGFIHNGTCNIDAEQQQRGSITRRQLFVGFRAELQAAMMDDEKKRFRLQLIKMITAFKSLCADAGISEQQQHQRSAGLLLSGGEDQQLPTAERLSDAELDLLLRAAEGAGALSTLFTVYQRKHGVAAVDGGDIKKPPSSKRKNIAAALSVIANRDSAAASPRQRPRVRAQPLFAMRDTLPWAPGKLPGRESYSNWKALPEPEKGRALSPKELLDMVGRINRNKSNKSAAEFASGRADIIVTVFSSRVQFEMKFWRYNKNPQRRSSPPVSLLEMKGFYRKQAAQRSAWLALGEERALDFSPGRMTELLVARARAAEQKKLEAAIVTAEKRATDEEFRQKLIQRNKHQRDDTTLSNGGQRFPSSFFLIIKNTHLSADQAKNLYSEQNKNKKKRLSLHQHHPFWDMLNDTLSSVWRRDYPIEIKNRHLKQTKEVNEPNRNELKRVIKIKICTAYNQPMPKTALIQPADTSEGNLINLLDKAIAAGFRITDEDFAKCMQGCMNRLSAKDGKATPGLRYFMLRVQPFMIAHQKRALLEATGTHPHPFPKEDFSVPMTKNEIYKIMDDRELFDRPWTMLKGRGTPYAQREESEGDSDSGSDSD